MYVSLEEFEHKRKSTQWEENVYLFLFLQPKFPKNTVLKWPLKNSHSDGENSKNPGDGEVLALSTANK